MPSSEDNCVSHLSIGVKESSAVDFRSSVEAPDALKRQIQLKQTFQNGGAKARDRKLGWANGALAPPPISESTALLENDQLRTGEHRPIENQRNEDKNEVSTFQRSSDTSRL